MSEMLITKGLAKTYSSDGTKVPALRGIDLAIGGGEFVAVMGPSGCGKSTLLNLMGGLDMPTAGEVHLAGERIDSLSEAKRAVKRRRHIGVIFQEFNLIGNLTVADNVELPALIAGYSAKQARERSRRLLEQLGMSDKASVVPARLSGGEQQRVAIARALVNNPLVLLADEPTGNLDSRSSRQVMALLSQHNAEGQTIVVVTHNHVVASAATRIIHMRDGTIADETKVESRSDSKALLSKLVDLEM